MLQHPAFALIVRAAQLKWLNKNVSGRRHTSIRRIVAESLTLLVTLFLGLPFQ